MKFRLRQIGNVAAAVAHKAFSVGATGTAHFVAPGAHAVVVGVYFFVTSATYHCRSPLTGVPIFGAPVAFFGGLPFLQKSAPALRRNCPLLRPSLYRACVFAPFCSQKKAAQIISPATKKAILLTVSYFCCIITIQICHRV